jgi:hypothetical protein
MQTVWLLARVALAAVFLSAALGKLADRPNARRAIADLGLSDWLVTRLAVLLPVGELLVAVALIPRASAPWGALGALGLLGAFTAVVARKLATGDRSDCNCFGRLHSAPLTWKTVGRNLALAGVAGGLAVGDRHATQPNAITGLAGLHPPGWLGSLLVVVLLAVVVIETTLLLSLLRQHGRLLTRVDNLELGGGGPPLATVSPGLRAPEFTLPHAAGGPVTLASLRSGGLPVMLVFADATCAPCAALLPQVRAWQRDHARRVRIAVLHEGRYPVEEAGPLRDMTDVMVDENGSVAALFGSEGNPSAVLISAEGRVVGDVAHGAGAIGALLDATVARAMPASPGRNGHAHLMEVTRGR